MLNYISVLANLKEGNERFINGQTIKCSYASLVKIKDSAVKGQFPKAIILCCSDARAPAEFVFDQDIGDLFVIRIAGNIVTTSIIGSIEFAVQAFNNCLVVVMGHTSCGAITEAMNSCNSGNKNYSSHLNEILLNIKPNIDKASKMQVPNHEKLHQAVYDNVEGSVKKIIKKSDVISNLIKEQKLLVIGSVLDLKTGRVNFFDNNQYLE